MTDHQPPTSDDETMSAIAKVLGHPTPTNPPPPPLAGGDFAGPSDPAPSDQATDGPTDLVPSDGPSSIVLRPTGPATPVAVTRRHLYLAVAAAIVAAGLMAAGVAFLVANQSDPAPAAADPAPTTTTVSSTTSPSTTTAPTTTTTPPAATTTIPPPVELSTATLMLPVPQTKAGPTPLGAVARPGEDVLVPDQTLITGKDATWQWEHCVDKRCSPIKGATATYYRLPADTKPGTKLRAALTITPDGQSGRIKVRTTTVTIIA